MLKEQSSRESNTEPLAAIARLQALAAKVEKTISEAEQNLARDMSLISEGGKPRYRDDSIEKILESLELLKNLEKDAVDDTHLEQLQAEEFEKLIMQLRERVKKLQENCDRMYKSRHSESLSSGNWEKIIEEKQATLSSINFGTDLPSVESQVKEHSIFHGEVELVGPLLTRSNDQDTDLQLKYNKLLASSAARLQDLLSLQDYMLRCTLELFWMEQQAEDRINYDWSDANLDYPSRQRQLEKFISKCFKPKEASITKLIDDGERLMAAGHPAKGVIKAHMEAVQADWKDCCRLLICEGNHLRHMEDYHKFCKAAREAQDCLKRMDIELNHRYKPEFKDTFQIEVLLSDLDDFMGALDQHEEQVKAVQKHSQQVFPLKVRREMPQKALLVEALCDFDVDQGRVICGQRYDLLSNNGQDWIVKDSSGHKLSAPAVCFVILPTDPEAIALSENITSGQNSIKQKISTCKDILHKQLEELKKQHPSVVDGQDQLCLQLMASLEKVTNDLGKQEKVIYGILRPALQQKNPFEDSTNRLCALRDIEACIQKIEAEKTSKVHAAETFLTSHPKCAGASQLFANVNKANEKYGKVTTLLNCAQDKFLNSKKLESSLQTARNLLSTYEMTLAEEQVIPSEPSLLERMQEDLLKMSSDLESKRSALIEAEKNLRDLRSSCEDMVSKVQEHCPEISRQQAEVHRLRMHQELISKQVEARSKSLQRAKAALNSYRSQYNDLNAWLCQLPNYEPRDTDNIQELDAKLKKQRNLLSNIARKESDLHNLLKHAQLYQQAVEDYEAQALQLNSFLDLEDGLVQQTRNKLESPAFNIKNEEFVIGDKFMEVCAINKHRLHNLEYALNLLSQNGRAVRFVERGEPWTLKENLETEKMEDDKDDIMKGMPQIRKNGEQEEILKRLKDELAEVKKQRTSKENEVTELQRAVRRMAEKSKDQGEPMEEEGMKVVKDPELEYRELLESLKEEIDNRERTEEEVRLLQERLRRFKNDEPEKKISVNGVLPRDGQQLTGVHEDVKARCTSSNKGIEDLQRKTNLTEQGSSCTGAEFQLQGIQGTPKVTGDKKSESETQMELEQLRNKIEEKSYEIEKNNLEILKLNDEVQQLKATAPEKTVKEVIQYRDDSNAKHELETLKGKLSEEENRYLDLEKEKSALEQKVQLRKTPLLQDQDKVISQEGKDPLLESEHFTSSESTSNEQGQRGALEDDLCTLQGQKTSLEIQLELEQEHRARKQAEMQVQMLKERLKDLEDKNKETSEKMKINQNVAIEQDSQENEYFLLRQQFQEERDKQILLEKQINSLQQRETSAAKTAVLGSVVLSEKGAEDPKGELEIGKLKRTLKEETDHCCELNKQLIDVNCQLSDMENRNEAFNKELEHMQAINNKLHEENQRLKSEIGRCDAEIQIRANETKPATDSPRSHDETNMEAKLASLQKELSEIRRVNNQKDQEIEHLKKDLLVVRAKKEQRESHVQRSIMIIDPDTHKEMKPQEAYLQGFIDWTLSVNLQNQECNWEMITMHGPKGESSVLHDKKSGKRFSIEDALKAGNITQQQLQLYRNDQMSMQEFGNLVSGRNKMKM